MTLHAGHSIPVTSDKADLYRRQKLLYAESVLTVAATQNNGGNTMNELKSRIHDKVNGLDYVLAGDYYIPVIELPWDEDRPVGKWGRMHRAYLEETNPLLLNHLILTGKLYSYLADLNEQAQDRCQLIIRQMAAAEGVTGELKRRSQWEWVKAMNSIVSRAEEIIKSEIINA